MKSGVSATYAKATVAESSRQYEAPTQEKSRTRSVGEETQSRTRTRPDGVGSVGTAVTNGQASTGQASGKAGSGKTSDRKKNNGVIRGLLSGTLISENLILRDMRYSALIALLIIIFIANRFNAERVERQIIVLEEEVSDLRAESLSVSADLGSVSRQSEITDIVKERGLGLEELREPPYRIVVNE